MAYDWFAGHGFFTYPSPMRRNLTITALVVVLVVAVVLGLKYARKTDSNANTNVAAYQPVLKLIEPDGLSLNKKKLTYTVPLLVCDTPPCDQFSEPVSGKISNSNTFTLPDDTNLDIRTMRVTIEGYQEFTIGNDGIRRPNGDWEIRLQK